ncbi:hypothetical protein LIER_33434 [Lithospermum erythrorhizon]|uniref:Uncharacterized protein n=1 Tax=Lithospermum erythrorhizon TaxID=34254 RepID=A0AAV3S2C7_LITER
MLQSGADLESQADSTLLNVSEGRANSELLQSAAQPKVAAIVNTKNPSDDKIANANADKSQKTLRIDTEAKKSVDTFDKDRINRTERQGRKKKHTSKDDT